MLRALLVVVLVEQLGGSGASTYGFAVTKDDKTIFETADEMSVDASGARAVVAAQLAPGRYTLKAASVDAAGRAGSVELPLMVALRQGGTLQFSDLVVGTESDSFAPSIHVAQGATIGAVLELYTTDPAQFDGVAVDLEVLRAGESEQLARAAAAVNKTAAERRRVAIGRVPLEKTEPGACTVSAVVRRGSVPLAKVSRSIVIVKK